MPGRRISNRLKKIGKGTGRCLQSAGWQLCKCVFWTVLSPCFCCIVLCPHRRLSRRPPRAPFEAPKPMLPSPRRRRLSLPSTGLQQSQWTFDQAQSPFMSKLPLEIRRMIYEKALGEMPIHISLAEGELNARRCNVGRCACYLRPLAAEQKLYLALPLLRTCRRIYSEAIEYLYKTNDFFVSTDIEDYPTTGYLPFFIQPQRIAQITNLRIDWDLDRHQFFQAALMPSPHRDEWYRTWNVLRWMKGLRKLHVRLFFFLDLWEQCYGEFWKQNSEALLEPIKGITAPKDFVVILPDWRCSTDIDVGESKCILELPEGNDDSS